MKVFIHCFSATGNTARAARIVADRLAAAGRAVAFHAIDGRAAPPAEIPDLTILAFPVWSWAAPHFARAYARRLPKANGARAAVLATCGAFGGQAVGEMARALRRRGYAVVGSGEMAYPDNWVLAVNPPTGEDLAAELASRGHDLTDPAASFFGRGQAIWRLDSGVYVGGSEPRADGMALGW